MGGETSSKKKKRAVPKPVNPHAAGVDLGSRSHYVALPADRGQNVRQFDCFTDGLEAMGAWMTEHGITTVAMEATGVYWVPVYDVLVKAGLDVNLVYAKHYQNVPGRKTDVSDCQWLQYLHQCGLVRGSFRPSDAICRVRTYQRQRDTLVEECSRHVLRMQKALEQMNVQLHKVVSNVMGKTGLSIMEAILDGERDPQKLALLRNSRCKSSEYQIAKALRGNWREEHLFCLRQEHAMYTMLQAKIADCEAAAIACWRQMEGENDPHNLPPPRSKGSVGPMREQLFRITGHDVFALEGLGATIVPQIVAETGTDMTPWPTEKHFVSWARICPTNTITGGQRKKGPRAYGRNRVAQAFKLAAQSLANSKTALGAYYRRIRSRRGSCIANAATAHKLARIFYRLMKHGDTYVSQAADYYEKRYKTRLTQAAIKTLDSLGMDVTSLQKQVLTMS